MTRLTLTRSATIVTLLAACAGAVAQAPGYGGPSAPAPSPAPAKPASGYSGPTTVKLMTVKQLLDTGKDDQHVTLRGKLVRHTGGERYDFADTSGQVRVEIEAAVFPAGVKIDATTEVELTGEFDKERFGTSEVEVSQLRVVTR